MLSNRLWLNNEDRMLNTRRLLTPRALIRVHLEELLKECARDYIIAPRGKIVPDPETNLLTKVVGFGEKELALNSLFFVSDARAQANKPVGKAADKGAYQRYIVDGGKIVATSWPGERLSFEYEFTFMHPKRRGFRAEVLEHVRNDVLPDGAGFGVDYAARVVLGDVSYPGLELPLITNDVLVAGIRAELLSE